ncbi:MAG: hypothetical protein WCK32_01215 [Chlorobiaceae bacterium]
MIPICNQIDFNEIEKINLNWILTGEGEMFASEGNAHYEEIGRLAEELVKEIIEKP